MSHIGHDKERPITYARKLDGINWRDDQPPAIHRAPDRDWDLRDRDPALLAALGWLPVTTTERPADTDTTTTDRSLGSGETPVEVWTPRPWTVEELTAREQADTERARYETHEAILDATAALMADAHVDGQPWVQPTAAHDAYPLGITVTHGGKTWENLTPANVWQPGVSGWRELVAQGYPAWVQPTGGHDAYKKGDRVSFDGSNYESLIDANVWSPTGYPAGWRKL